MAQERFTSFNPHTMDHQQYLKQFPNFGSEKDKAVVSVLTGIFNPLAQEFRSRVGELKRHDIASLHLPGGEPVLTEYDHWLHEPRAVFGSERLLPFPERFSSHQDPKDPNAEASIYAPVGAYGREFSVALVQTARAMYSLIDDVMPKACGRAMDRFSDHLIKETFQKDPLWTLKEAPQTIAATLSIFMAQKLDGYEDPIQLAQDFVHKKTLNKIGRLMPLYKTLPTAREGWYFDRPFADGEPRLQLRESLVQEMHAVRNYLFGTTGPKERAQGCPASRMSVTVFEDGVEKRTSGIDLFAQTFVDILPHFYQTR